ncbi:hypothetical protein ACFX2I_022276 [Malus domestica]
MLMARSEVKCYCYGLTEECTPAYVATVKERHQDRWICRLCAEAIKDENSRSSRKISTEEAMKRHVSFCEEFRMSSPPVKPTEYLISAMKQLLRRTKDSQRRERLGGCRPGMFKNGATLHVTYVTSNWMLQRRRMIGRGEGKTVKLSSFTWCLMDSSTPFFLLTASPGPVGALTSFPGRGAATAGADELEVSRLSSSSDMIVDGKGLQSSRGKTPRKRRRWRSREGELRMNSEMKTREWVCRSKSSRPRGDG